MTYQRSLAVSLLALSFCSTVARADPEPAPPAKSKNRWTALALSLGGTAASATAIAVGAGEDHDGRGPTSSRELMIIGATSLVITPSLGEWYAGRTFTPGLALRVVGGALAAGGFALAMRNHGDPAANLLFGVPGIISGGALLIAGATVDIERAPAAADEYNTRLQVTPMVVPTSTGVAPGFGLTGRF